MTFRTLISHTLRWKKSLLPIIIALAVFALPARAGLGGTVESVKSDQEAMKGTLQVTSLSGYEIHEIQSPQGVKVREFVSPNGTVFGVAWQGPWTPDLHQLLGQYFDQYVKAAQSKKTARGPVSIQLPGLVVERGGHPRSFVGRAFVPEMIPQGVTADAIK
jgi:hypothetical protein